MAVVETLEDGRELRHEIVNEAVSLDASESVLTCACGERVMVSCLERLIHGPEEARILAFFHHATRSTEAKS